jgi:formate dehydrogenase subunit gamma
MTTTGVTAKGVTGDHAGRDSFLRFSPIQRTEHAVLMVTFVMLAVTGLAQRYSTVGWSAWLILHLGGIAYTRLIHRGFAVIFMLSALFHFGYIAYSYFIKHRNLPMLPTLKDFQDAIGALRYAFGFTDRSPQFGRFDYRQKFEYWGLIFGSTVIIVTGLILAYPVAVTTFLPGQVVAAAVEFHGFEATLAVLTIIIWHLYDVIFRPGVFPADTSIFTGKISRERALEEHPLEYTEREAAPASEDTNPPFTGENQVTTPGQQP